MDNQQPSINLEWRVVKEYDRYEVNQLGEIRHRQRKKVLTPRYNKGGYGYVNFNINGHRTNFAIHRIVANAFIPNPEHKLEVNHIDGNTKNNRADNLEWATSSENKIHAYKKEENHNVRGKRIIQYDLQGNYLATYSTIMAAAKAVGVTKGAISHCCCGVSKSSGGYIWKIDDGSTTKCEQNPSSPA